MGGHLKGQKLGVVSGALTGGKGSRQHVQLELQMNQMEREHKPPEHQKFTALSRNGMEPQFTSLRSNALTEHPSAQLHALSTPCLSVLRSTRKESGRPPVLLLRPLHSTLLISSPRGVKGMGQMHLSPLFPAPFEPLPSSWARYGLVIGARLWCPGMGTVGDPHNRAQHLVSELPWGEGYWERMADWRDCAGGKKPAWEVHVLVPSW